MDWYQLPTINDYIVTLPFIYDSVKQIVDYHNTFTV